jgi:hypothetical protein
MTPGDPETQQSAKQGRVPENSRIGVVCSTQEGRSDRSHAPPGSALLLQEAPPAIPPQLFAETAGFHG